MKPPLLNRILATTDAPHNVFTQRYQNKAPYTQPIHIVRTIIQLHYQLLGSNSHKKYQLSETNDLFFNKAINLFPSLNPLSPIQYTITAKHEANNFLEKWVSKLKYEKSNTNQQQKPLPNSAATSTKPTPAKSSKPTIPLMDFKDTATQTDIHESTQANEPKHAHTQTSPLKPQTATAMSPTTRSTTAIPATATCNNSSIRTPTTSPISDSNYPLVSTQISATSQTPTLTQTTLHDYNKENTSARINMKKRQSTASNIQSPKIQRKTLHPNVLSTTTHTLENFIMQKSANPDELLLLLFLLVLNFLKLIK